MNHRDDFKTGDIAIAIENFDPVDSNYLTLRNGSTIIVEALTEHPDILKCRCNQSNSVGLVMKQYIQKRSDITITTQQWFWGKISRETANELLETAPISSFLVRESFTTTDQVLCVRSPEEGIKHYLIKRTSNGGYSLGESPIFESVIDLINFHLKNDGNLGYKLKIPVDRDSTSGFNNDSLIETLKKAGWWINYEALTFDTKLGSGQFGDVYKIIQGSSQKAAKILKSSAEDTKAFLSEALVMSQLHHQNLVEMHGVSIKDGRLILLMELCKKGTLYKYLTCQGRNVISKSELVRLLKEIATGMYYLESKYFIHRDLSARNVLLTENMTAKITDFGLSIKASSDVKKVSLPVRWTAPESLKSKNFSSKSDVWSFGIVIWECFSYGKLPYSQESNEEVERVIVSGKKLECPPDCPMEIIPIMFACWKSEPEHRPSFSVLSQKLSLIKI